MANYTITLTEEQKDRLVAILACHLDLTIQPKLDKAMSAHSEAEVARLMQLKASDKAIHDLVFSAKEVH